MEFRELLAIIARAFSFQRFGINRLFLDAGGCVIGNPYNAPIAGAVLVAEIVLGSVAMEIFGPLKSVF